MPGCSERCLPGRGGGRAIDSAGQRGNHSAGLSVIGGQRSAAIEIMRSRGRSAAGIDPMQAGQEVRQRGGEFARIGDAIDGRDLAFEPTVDGPVPGIPIPGIAFRQRSRNRQWKERSEPRQPSCSLSTCAAYASALGSRTAHLVAKMKRSVVPPARFHRSDGQMRPGGKLRGDQTAHERCIDFHAGRCHVVSLPPVPSSPVACSGAHIRRRHSKRRRNSRLKVDTSPKPTPRTMSVIVRSA